jgi:hypothetical protein
MQTTAPHALQKTYELASESGLMGLEAGTVRIIAALLVGCLFVNSISGYNMPQPPSPQTVTLPCLFEVTQGGSDHPVEPVERAQTVSSFYNYYSDSAHTPFVEAYVSVLYLYLDTGSSKLYFVFHFNVDGSGTPDALTDVELQGIPAGASVAVSDDPGEFNLARNPQGQFHYFTNTDEQRVDPEGGPDTLWPGPGALPALGRR